MRACVWNCSQVKSANRSSSILYHRASCIGRKQTSLNTKHTDGVGLPDTATDCPLLIGCSPNNFWTQPQRALNLVAAQYPISYCLSSHARIWPSSESSVHTTFSDPSNMSNQGLGVSSVLKIASRAPRRDMAVLPPTSVLRIGPPCRVHIVLSGHERQRPRPHAVPSRQNTTYMNGRPPLISRVCHESRCVSLSSLADSRTSTHSEWPAKAQWQHGWRFGSSNWQNWRDRTRDAVHLNWEPAYDADWGPGGGRALPCLAWDASHGSAGGSMMPECPYSGTLTAHSIFDESDEDYIPEVPTPPDYIETPLSPNMNSATFEAIQQLSKWMVVMRVLVVHSQPQSRRDDRPVWTAGRCTACKSSTCLTRPRSKHTSISPRPAKDDTAVTDWSGLSSRVSRINQCMGSDG